VPCVTEDVISLRITEGWEQKTGFIFSSSFFLFIFFYVWPFHGSVANCLPLIMEAGFKSRPCHVGFAVAEMALGHVLSEYFGFHSSASFHPFTLKCGE
jgi:hypothetical protein